MKPAETLKLTLPNDLSYLPIALGFVRATAAKFGFQDPELGQIELAAEEAAANVVRHAYEAGERDAFDVRCERLASGMQVVIKDRGIPFDPSLIPDYRPEDAARGGEVSSLGTFLMKKAMDKVSFVNLGSHGKEIRLLKLHKRRSIEEYFPGDKPQAAEPKPIEGKIPYDVRPMRPEEAVEVSRCAYKSHGRTFFDSAIYFPERLAELNAAGELLSVVSVTKEDAFMGHTALRYPHAGARIAELTYAFVNLEYRGQGCLTRMIEQLYRMDKKWPLDGVYANAVTNHLFTQKAMVKYGINDCGVFLGASPGTWVFKGISGESLQRLSVVLCFKYLQAPPRLVLYPPSAHKDMVAFLYSNVGASHELRAPGPGQASPEREETVLRCDVFDSEGCGEIWVEAPGRDALARVRSSLRDFKLRKLGAIYLYLPLEDPATHFLAPALEKLGFFFSGILPRTDVGDALILQCIDNLEMDYGKIQVLTEPGRRLIEYVRERDPNRAH
jgi:serine/threonine-protein kinase RsbW